jgi:trk system potassium uptake protein
MNITLVFKILGILLILFSGTMLLPLLINLIYAEGSIVEFALPALFTCLFGSVLFGLCHKAQGPLSHRGAFLLVALVWFVVPFFGSLPFYLSGYFSTFIDAWFEASSGFTTTGATVIGDVESLSHGILFWRSFTQFVGGMGIIVLSLAILPILGVGGMSIFRAESPGPTNDKISARVSETARVLWGVYILFTLLVMILLSFCGLSIFDAINHAMTTMSTGGFSTRNDSIAGFNSVAVEIIIMLFMFLASINFLLHYRLLVLGETKLFKNSEVRFYTLVVVCSILLIAIDIWGKQYDTLGSAFRYASFQVLTLASSTGYATADFAIWSPFSQVLLLCLMIMGGCAGSTAGGIKGVRAQLLVKQGYRELIQLIHPRAVLSLKLGNQTVPSHISSAIFGFFFLYCVSLTIGTLIVTVAGLDVITAISTVISALSNIGPALGQAGPMLNYGEFPALAKGTLGVLMIIGRLELFTVLILFTPDFWRS